MLERYGLRLSRCRPLISSQPTKSIGLQHGLLVLHRSQSTSETNRERKLPGSDTLPRGRRWRNRFLGGIVVGLVLSQTWLYFDGQQKSSFVTYRLVAKEPVSSTASIFHLTPLESSSNFEIYKEAWKRGIWNVHFKQPQIQIVRAYTPLPPVEDDKSNASTGGARTGSLRFLIRHDPHGEVSSYLHRLPIGANIEMRGPNLEYELPPEVRQVVFFAGGTGIAPALQIAHTLFETDAEKSKDRSLHILWANRKREDCLGGISDAPADDPLLTAKSQTSKSSSSSSWSGFLSGGKKQSIISPETSTSSQEKGLIVQELENIKAKYPGQVTVEYFVNSESTWIDEEAVFRSLSRFDDKDFSQRSPSSSEQRQILISGPNGFITYLAGPKEWNNGREGQGNVSRIVAHAIAQNPHHVKVWKI